MSPAEGRMFAVTVGTAFLVLAAVFWWRGHQTFQAVAGGLGLLLLAAGAVVPGRLTPVRNAWMKLGERISRVMNPLVMGIIYYLVLTPTGVLRRLLGSNPIERSRDAETFWVPRDEEVGSDLERQF